MTGTPCGLACTRCGLDAPWTMEAADAHESRSEEQETKARHWRR